MRRRRTLGSTSPPRAGAGLSPVLCSWGGRHPVGLGPGFPALPRDRRHCGGWALSRPFWGTAHPSLRRGCCAPGWLRPLAAGPPGAAVPPERGAGAGPGAGAAPGLPVAAGSAARRAPRHQALPAGRPRPGHQLHRPAQPRAGPRAPPASALLPAPQTPAPAPRGGETRAPLPRGAAPEHHTPGCPLRSTQSLGPPLSPVRASSQPPGPQCTMGLVPGVPSTRWSWSLVSPVRYGAGPWGPQRTMGLVPGVPSAPQQPFPQTTAKGPQHAPRTPAVGPWVPHPQAWGTSSSRTGTTLPAPAPLSLLQKWPMRSRLYTSPWGGPVSAPPRHSRQQPPAHRPGEQQAGSGGQPPLAPGVPTGAPTAQGHRAPGWTGAAARAGGSVPVGFAPQPRMAVPSSAGSGIPAPVLPWAQPCGQDPRDTGWAGAGEGVHTQHCSRGWGHPAPPAAINLQPPPHLLPRLHRGCRTGPQTPTLCPVRGGEGVLGALCPPATEQLPPGRAHLAPRPGPPAGHTPWERGQGQGCGRKSPRLAGLPCRDSRALGDGATSHGLLGDSGGLCGAGPGAPNTCAPEPFIGGQQTQRGVTRAGGRSAPGGWGGPWPGSGA